MLWLCIAAVLAGCGLPPLSAAGAEQAAAAAAAGGTPSGLSQVTVVLRKPDDQGIITVTPGQAVIEFFSPSGIGGATVTFGPGPIPQTILLRFHLRGLEGLDVAYGQTQVHVSLPSDGGPPQETVTELGQGPGVIGPGSPYWMEVTRSATGPTDPNAYIQAAMPQDFILGGDTAFSVQWVDFYR